MTDDARFTGFDKPTFTQIPDQVLDELMPVLSEAELKVLLYICRRTFGFHKDADAISLSQLVDGITTKDGRILDRGTGMSKSSVRRGMQGLVDRGIIDVRKTDSPAGDSATNIYSLHFLGGSSMVEPPGSNLNQEVVLQQNHGGSVLEPGVVLGQNPQQTVEQQTELQEKNLSNYSKEPDVFISREDVERIVWVIREISRELGDQAPVKSTTTRASRLYAQSELSLDDFLDAMQTARLRTKQYTASIKTERVSLNGGLPIKPKVAYFFGVLEGVLEESSGKERQTTHR